MKRDLRKTLISLLLTFFFLSPLSAGHYSNDSESSLDAIFQDGKKEFFRELKLRFGLHPSKFSLLPESVAKVENAERELPFIYENLINIMYLSEEPHFRELKNRKSQDSWKLFRERFVKLSQDTAARFVLSLFSAQSAVKAERQEEFASGKNRLELILASFQKRQPADGVFRDWVLSEASPAALYKSWGFEVSGFSEAHRFSKGEGVKIAVIDSGVCDNCNLLEEDRINRESSFSLIGRNQPPWVLEDIPVVDDCGHGTVMTSLIMGAAPESDISIYRVSYASHHIYPYWPAMQAAQAIYKAVHDGMDVICVGAVFDVDFTFLQKACEYAYENNVVVVCPNGRSSDIHPSKAHHFPAHYNTTVAVGGIIPDGKLSPSGWNQSGSSHYSSVAAPAAIVGFGIGGGLKSDSYFQDNSWAAALTGGLVALVSSKIPESEEDLSGQYFQRIYEIITQSANPHILGFKKFSSRMGYGLIDAEKSVGEGLQAYLTKMKQIEENFKRRMADRAKREQDVNREKKEKE